MVTSKDHAVLALSIKLCFSYRLDIENLIFIFWGFGYPCILSNGYSDQFYTSVYLLKKLCLLSCDVLSSLVLTDLL